MGAIQSNRFGASNEVPKQPLIPLHPLRCGVDKTQRRTATRINLQERKQMNLDDIQIDFRIGSFQHKVIALLSKSDSDTAYLRRDSGATIKMDRVREILNDMKRAKLITSTGHDTWAITNQGLHVSVILGSVPDTALVIKQRSKTEKLAEVYQRENYVPKELGFTCLRQGAYDAFILPSRIANNLHYPGGRTETTDHANK